MKKFIYGLLILSSVAAFAGVGEDNSMTEFLKSESGWRQTLAAAKVKDNPKEGDTQLRKDTIKCLGFSSDNDGVVVGTCLIEAGVVGEAVDFLYSISVGVKNRQRVVSVKYLTLFHID